MQSYGWSFELHAISGKNSWNNLVRWSERTDPTPNIVVLDAANDNTSGDYRILALEALIRTIWNDNPNTKICGWNWPRYTDPTNDDVDVPANAAALADIESLYSHYGITLIDYWDALSNAVSGGGTLLDYYDAGDGVHPLEAGHDLAYGKIQPIFPGGGGSKPSTLPARLFDNGDFEQAPTVKDGTDYDSQSGTGWVDDGTSTSSSTADDTITYSFTGRSFGCYRSDSIYPTVEIDIDGAGYVEIDFDDNGYDIGSRAAHIVVIKVLTEVTIDEFWAI